VNALTVSLDTPARNRGQVDAVLASLPVSLVPAPNGSADLANLADLVALDGGSDWTTRLDEVLARGARGAVLVSPTVTTRDPEALPIPVVVDFEFAGRPGLEAVRAAVEDAGPTALLEVRSVFGAGRSDGEIVLELFSLVRHVLGAGVTQARLLLRSADGLAIRAHAADGRAILFTNVRTNAVDPVVTLRVVGPAGAVSVRIPSSATSRPVEVVVTDASGARMLPTHWETSHRAAWRRLRDAVNHSTPTADLGHLGQDLSLLTTSLPELLP